MLLIIVALGSVSVAYVRQILNKDSNAITMQVANAEADKINNVLEKMEYTVRLMENYVSYSLKSSDELSDPEYAAAFLEEMKTILLSTHIFSLVEKICDRVGVIIDGKMVAEGEVKILTAEKSLEDVFFDIYQQVKGGEV